VPMTRIRIRRREDYLTSISFHTLDLSFHLLFPFLAQTSITVQFQPLENVGSGSSYVLQWKEYPDSWDGGASESATTTSAAASASLKKMEAAPLKPGTTYCVRLVIRSGGESGSDGPPSADLVVDTEQVGCTPQQKSCCALL
jgi:hypothetical protein